MNKGSEIRVARFVKTDGGTAKFCLLHKSQDCRYVIQRPINLNAVCKFNFCLLYGFFSQGNVFANSWWSDVQEKFWGQTCKKLAETNEWQKRGFEQGEDVSLFFLLFSVFVYTSFYVSVNLTLIIVVCSSLFTVYIVYVSLHVTCSFLWFGQKSCFEKGFESNRQNYEHQGRWPSELIYFS